MTRTTKSALAEQLYDFALRIIEDENYDIINSGDFLPEDFAGAAVNVFKQMLRAGRTKNWIFNKEPASVYTMGYNWKFCNRRPCFISCSDDNRTGVSRSEGCIMGRIYGFADEDVKELLDMMNEAWYHATQNNDEL